MFDTTGAGVAKEPELGPAVRHGYRSQSETDLPNSHKAGQSVAGQSVTVSQWR
jgi:hypothetical protein